SIFRQQHPPAVTLQCRFAQTSQNYLIVDKENRAVAGHSRGNRLRNVVNCLGRNRRQQDLERTPKAGSGGDQYCAFLRSHNAGGRRESQPPTRKLRGEEGIKDSVFGGLIHARAVISNLDVDIGAGDQLTVWELSLDIFCIQITTFSPDQY